MPVGGVGAFEYLVKQVENAASFRYSLDDGRSWVYGDLDGSRNGYDPAAAGTLTVTF
jgi:hypothetical protein